MTDQLALVLPEVYGEYDSLAALWVLRLAQKEQFVLREISKGMHSEELRLLIGIQPTEGDLSAHELLPLLKLRLGEIEETTSLVQSALTKNVQNLFELLGLSETSKQILIFVALACQHTLLHHLMEVLCKNTQDGMIKCLSVATGISIPKVSNALRQDSELMSFKLVYYNKSFPASSMQLELMDELRDVLFIAHADVQSLMKCFIEVAPATDLEPDDFPHLTNEFQLIQTYFKYAQSAGVYGGNILIYGLPGVGKTEYVRAIAQVLGKSLYQVKCADDEGNSISGRGRLMFYQLSQRFLKQSNALVLFDEIEDIFGSAIDFEPMGYSRTKSIGKAWLNNLLENNPVPTIWISNAIDHIDKAYLRRFDFSVEMKLPPKVVRDRMLQRYLKPYALSVSTLSYLSQQPLTPAQIEKAAKVLKAFDDEPSQHDATLKHIIKNSMHLLEQQPVQDKHGQRNFDMQYLNVDIDVDKWLSQIKLAHRVQGAFCFYGAPGTGKTLLAHHIAQSLNRPLHIKSASQILSPYVGMTEANMAHMFKHAQQDGAILLLDEADSFLTQRSLAHAHWQTTQVNEMLVNMEQFEGLFICTTNLMQNLDEASLRRFTFKVKFDFLSKQQRWQLFQHYVSRIPAYKRIRIRQLLDAMDTLTPGDYANVHRQYTMLEAAPNVEDFLERLILEYKAKPHSTQRSIGFV